MKEHLEIPAKRILVVVAEMGHPAENRIRGISQYAKRAGWTVNVLEPRHSGDKSDFARWIDFWHPDGLVVDSEYMADILSVAPDARPPVIFGDTVAPSELPEGCAKVASDARAIAEAAVRELLRAGHPHFAFVPALGNLRWSRSRAEAFASAARGCGNPVSEWNPSPAEFSDTIRFHAGLARFLRALPKPCGLFAANDATAALVASACAECGLAVPDDIAIVGVDDHEEYCERVAPTLTSIRLDFVRCGVAAMELLSRMMGSEGTGARRLVGHYGVERVVRRASTSVLRVHDGRVSRALEWIRLHATKPIGAEDVVAQMGCSRSLANLRFRQATGHTILDEIHARRLDLVQSLLKRDDVPIDAIPERCGYVRGPYLGILFKRTTGLTMRQWRREFRRQGEFGILGDGKVAELG